MSERNKAAMREMSLRILADPSSVDDYVAEDFEEHSRLPGVPANREGMRQALEMFTAAFSDLEVRFEDEIAEGDKVVQRVRVKGTQTGEFFGMPATGKTFEIDEIHIMRVRDRKLVERWSLTDSAEMMKQLGIT
jgi:predicted ester cyclase